MIQTGLHPEVPAISRQPHTYSVSLEPATSDPVNLQVHEWAGSSDPVLLLHATGFHSRCWDSIARQLENFHIFAVDIRFHGGSDRHGPVDWRLMARDVELLLDQLKLERVTGVGHSMGGYLAAFVAAQRVERFRQLVLIDPVILPSESYSRHFSGAKPRNPAEFPVSKRRNRWLSPGEMYERFRERAPFNRWQDQVLRDYCDYALLKVPDETMLQLACDPLHEASIYLNHQGNEIIHEYLPRLDIPTVVMRAPQNSEDFYDFSSSPTWPGLADVLPKGCDMFLPELSHFIPMEAPDLVAQVIRERMKAN